MKISRKFTEKFNIYRVVNFKVVFSKLRKRHLNPSDLTPIYYIQNTTYQSQSIMVIDEFTHTKHVNIFSKAKLDIHFLAHKLYFTRLFGKKNVVTIRQEK